MKRWQITCNAARCGTTVVVEAPGEVIARAMAAAAGWSSDGERDDCPKHTAADAPPIDWTDTEETPA